MMDPINAIKLFRIVTQDTQLGQHIHSVCVWVCQCECMHVCVYVCVCVNVCVCERV
jgi:hypothetical protein